MSSLIIPYEPGKVIVLVGTDATMLAIAGIKTVLAAREAGLTAWCYGVFSKRGSAYKTLGVESAEVVKSSMDAIGSLPNVVVFDSIQGNQWGKATSIAMTKRLVVVLAETFPNSVVPKYVLNADSVILCPSAGVVDVVVNRDNVKAKATIVTAASKLRASILNELKSGEKSIKTLAKLAFGTLDRPYDSSESACLDPKGIVKVGAQLFFLEKKGLVERVELGVYRLVVPDRKL